MYNFLASAKIIYLIGIFINILTLTTIKYFGLKNQLSIEQIIFYRTTISVLFLLPKNIKNFKIIPFKDRSILLLILSLGILSSFDAYAWNNVIRHIPMNNAMMLAFLSPITTSIISGIVLKEHISKKIMISFIFNTACLFFIYGFSSDQFNVWYIVMFSELFIYGFTAVLIRKLPSYPSDFLLLLRLIVLLPISILFIGSFPALTLSDIMFILFITAGYIIERTLITYAYQIASVTSIQPIRYLNIVFSAILSYLILGEKLTLGQVIGLSLIFSFILISTQIGKRKTKK